MSSLSSRLAQLEHSGLIHQSQAWPESEYPFKHTLVQDEAYGTLLMDEIASILGRHFAEAQLLQVLSKAKDVGTIILQWEIQALSMEI